MIPFIYYFSRFFFFERTGKSLFFINNFQHSTIHSSYVISRAKYNTCKDDTPETNKSHISTNSKKIHSSKYDFSYLTRTRCVEIFFVIWPSPPYSSLLCSRSWCRSRSLQTYLTAHFRARALSWTKKTWPKVASWYGYPPWWVSFVLWILQISSL